MAHFSRFLRLKPHFNHRQFSAIAKPDSETILANKQKVRTALSLLENKNNPISSAEQILYLALSDAVSTFPHSESSSDSIPSFLRELKSQPSLLRSLLDELKSRPDLRKERFFSYFITLYGQAEMYDSAIQTFKDMAAAKIAPSTESLNVLLRAGLYEGNISKVTEIFNEFSDTYDITPDVETYNILLEGFLPLGFWNHKETVCSLLEQMRCVPDNATCNIFMEGLQKETDEHAANIIQHMVERKIFLFLDSRVYNLGIQIFCKLKEIEEAIDLFDTVNSHGLKPDADNYEHLFRLCCVEDEAADFCETAFTICKQCFSEKWFADAFFSDLTIFKSLMRGILMRGKYDMGRQLNDMMEENGVQADIEFYNGSIQCLCKLGRLVEAKALVEGLEAKDVKPGDATYLPLIYEFHSKGDFEEVRRLYFDMNEKGVEPNRYTYGYTIKSLSELGDFETMFTVYKNCISAKYNLDKLSPQEILESMVTYLVRTFKYKQIGELLEMMENHESQAHVYNVVINSMCDSGKAEPVKEVMRLYNVMRQKGIEPYTDSYQTIMKFLVGCGDSENALQVCKHCMGKDWFQEFFFSSDMSTMKTLFSLITYIAKVQDTPEMDKDEGEVSQMLNY